MSEAYNPPLGSGLCLPGNKESVDTSHSIGKDLDLKGCDLMPFILQTPLNFKMNRQYIGNELISGGFFHSSRLRQDREGRKADKRGTAFSRSHPNSGMTGQSENGPVRDPTRDQFSEVDELLEKGQDHANLLANAFPFENVEYLLKESIRDLDRMVGL